jgi:hypothetical protein
MQGGIGIHFTCGFSRREFLAHTSCFGVFYALAMRILLPALAAELADDPRISQTPLVDNGFAAVRKIGNGRYAIISDYSKGSTTVCDGGFLIGKDALLIAGLTTPTGAAFQMAGALVMACCGSFIVVRFAARRTLASA